MASENVRFPRVPNRIDRATMVSRSLLLFVVVLSTTTLPQMVSGCGRGNVFLRHNGYRKLLIAIDDEVQESSALLQRIKDVFTNASKLLFQMTRQRAYFEDVHILIPESWPDAGYDVPTWQQADQSEVTVGPVPRDQEQQGAGYAPFTVRTTPCGELGHFIHLTPQYLLDDTMAEEFGPREKAFLHEWSHLRYGAFDEYNDGNDNSDFYAASNGELEGIRCPAQLRGEMWDAASQTPVCNFVDGQPDRNCRFNPDMNSLPQDSASLMFYTRSEQVSEWCDNDVTKPETLHNRQAPSQQNKQCDGKSIWEVLRDHGDFRDSQNPPSNTPAPEPRFTLVKRRSQRTAFVLDVSGSMDTNDRIKLLGQAFSNYLLRVAKDGEEVGIVWFDSKASIKVNLTQINNDTRRDLLQYVPTLASGGTSIGDGLLKGLEVLQGSEGSSSGGGGTIILLSDGQEAKPPFVRDVVSKLEDNNVRTHTIAVSEDADASLELVAEKTGGLSFSYADTTPSNALNDAFLAIASAGLPLKQQQLQIHSETITLDAGHLGVTAFVIDPTANNNVNIVVGYTDNNPPNVTVASPSGRLITSTSPEYQLETAFRTVSISLGHMSEAGEYQMNVTNPATKAQTLSITVTSKVTEGEAAPVIVTAQWRHQSVNDSATQQAIYVSVSKGYAPVLNAVVKATVENPSVTSLDSSTSSELTLLDNGAGSDIKKDDGIYSSFVTTYTADGRYSLKVLVRDSKDTVISNGVIGVGVPRSAERLQLSPDHGKRLTTTPGPFQRVSSGGSFMLRNFDASLGDLFPPSRITDLEVRAVTVNSVKLEWTAPGNDLDQGTAAGYVLKMTTEFELLYNNHTLVTNVSDQDIQTGSLTAPQPSGSRESVTVYVGEGAVSYHFAIQAYDNSSVSRLSNIVSATTAYAAQGESHFDVEVVVGIICGICGLLVVTVVIVILVYRHHSKTKNLERRRSKVFHPAF